MKCSQWKSVINAGDYLEVAFLGYIFKMWTENDKM